MGWQRRKLKSLGDIKPTDPKFYYDKLKGLSVFPRYMLLFTNLLIYWIIPIVGKGVLHRLTGQYTLAAVNRRLGVPFG